MPLPSFWPQVGAEIRLNKRDPTCSEHVPDEVELTKSRGAARIYECRGPDGQRGLIAIQPDKTWYWIANLDDPEDDDEEPWRG